MSTEVRLRQSMSPSAVIVSTSPQEYEGQPLSYTLNLGWKLEWVLDSGSHAKPFAQLVLILRAGRPWCQPKCRWYADCFSMLRHAWMDYRLLCGVRSWWEKTAQTILWSEVVCSNRPRRLTD